GAGGRFVRVRLTRRWYARRRRAGEVPGRTILWEDWLDGHRHREVVQRRQGLRLHHARRGRPRPLRPPHGNPDGGLSLTGRGLTRLLRGGAGRQGPEGGQRPEALAGLIAPRS